MVIAKGMHRIAAAVVPVFAVFLAAHAQGNVPSCVSSCIASGSQSAGCAGPSDWTCMCSVSSFHSNANRCFVATCPSTDEAQIGENMINVQCSGHTSTSIPPPFSPSLTVTNSETSPPQQSTSRALGPSLIPPTPPPSSASGPTTLTATQPPGTGTSGVFTSSAPSLTSSGVGSPSVVPSFGTDTGTGPSGVEQPAATGTPGGNGAGRVDFREEALVGALLGILGVWALL